jgi:hypothetical protein
MDEKLQVKVETPLRRQQRDYVRFIDIPQGLMDETHRRIQRRVEREDQWPADTAAQAGLSVRYDASRTYAATQLPCADSYSLKR